MVPRSVDEGRGGGRAGCASLAGRGPLAITPTVAKFWAAIELFHPPAIPGPAPGRWLQTVTVGQPLPWAADHPLSGIADVQHWRHVVYLGVFGAEALAGAARRLMPGATDPAREDGSRTALGAVVVDERGQPVPGSAVLSGCTWAIARMLTMGIETSDWLEGFNPYRADAVLRGWQSPGAVLDVARLVAWRTALAAAQRPPPEIDSHEIVIVSQPWPDGITQALGDPVNGLLPAACRATASRIVDRATAPALAALLGRPEAQQEITAGLLAATTAPDRWPPACWPDAPGDIRRQFAVNTIAGAAAGLSVVAVPPGTDGAGTLRDLVAAELVARAERLAMLTAPAQAFTRPGTPPAGPGSRAIVVQAPTSRCAQRIAALLNESSPGTAATVTGPPGTLAATLAGSMIAGRHAQQAGGSPPDWTGAVAALGDALGRERELRAQRSSVYELLRGRDRLDLQVSKAAAEVGRAESDMDQMRREIHDRASIVEAISSTLDDLQRGLAEHRKHRPRFPHTVFARRRRAAWEDDDSHLVDEIGRRESDLAKAGWDADLARVQVTQAETRHRAAHAALTEAVEVRDHAARRLSAARDRWGTVPRSADDSPDDAWSDPEWAAARSAVLAAAVTVQAAFRAGVHAELAGACQSAANLIAAGAPPPGASAEEIWERAFLATPVLVTTPAGFAELFGMLGGQGLGTVLVCGGEQQRPGQVLPALARARRVTVLGDRLRSVPVGIPAGIGSFARQSYGVPRCWDPARISAQDLADRRSASGVRVTSAHRTEFIAMPLTLCRGLAEPMFRVLNEAVYGRLLHGPPTTGAGAGNGAVPGGSVGSENGTGSAGTGGSAGDLPKSCWIDTGSVSAGQPTGGSAAAMVRALAGRVPERYSVAALTLRHDTALTAACAAAGIRCASAADAPEPADVAVVVLDDDPATKVWACATSGPFATLISAARRRIYVVGGRDSWRRYPYFAELAQALPVAEPPPW